MMKIVKLPVEYIRLLNAAHHVVYGRYEYWMFLNLITGLMVMSGVLDTSVVISKPETQKR